MNMIKNWVSGVIDRAQDAADRRLNQAMTCPGCEHFGEPEIDAPPCDCDRYDCLCALANVGWEGSGQ